MSTGSRGGRAIALCSKLNHRLFPNSIARSRVEKKLYVGDEIENCRDLSGLVYRRPFERVSGLSTVGES